MMNSLKMAEMQRANIEFERQRHLANWFIKSGPHMASPSTTIENASSTNSNNNNSNSNKSQKSHNATKSGTPLFLLVSDQKLPPPSLQPIGGNLPLTRPQMFTSQTNLPLQIVTSPSQEGRKPKLRRFNSHDTSANMFSVADFENARLERRNQIEMRQRLRQRYKMNSLSSDGDCSTGDSKGSKCSNNSQEEPLSSNEFLDRYSLPRVVRISHKTKCGNEIFPITPSTGTTSTTSSLPLLNKNSDLSKWNGELVLLYKHLRQRKIYHGYNTKSTFMNKKKKVKIPQEFPGYFSLINEKGIPTATMYTTLVQLIRERVYKFLSVDHLSAFTEAQHSEGISSRPQYIKTTANGGQVFRLLAVFEDGKETNNSQNKYNSRTGREREKGRYAQLLNENRQVLYVPLLAKGKFYEVEPRVPQLLKNTGNAGETPKSINADCVHQLSQLLPTGIEFPQTIKFISGATMTSMIPENITIETMSTENVAIGCPIDDIESQTNYHLIKLEITPDMIFSKSSLGFENERRMLSNQNVQNILKFCQFNSDAFVKTVELESSVPQRSASKSKGDGLNILKPINFPRLLKRDKNASGHEKEDSIIFLSKNDLACLESKDDEKQATQNQITEKMKVFQPNKKKWFKMRESTNSFFSSNADLHSKRMSMDRYTDMSKLLQERFGGAEREQFNERPASELGCSDNPKPQIQKSLSLQDVDFIDKPDVVPESYKDSVVNSKIGNATSVDSEQFHDEPKQQAFISEKMYSEFHVKTRQYSKSSCSLHQLFPFSASKRQTSADSKKPLKQLSLAENPATEETFEIKLTGSAHNETSMNATQGIIDDLPYSSVRDSLLICEINLNNSIDDDDNSLNQQTICSDTKENIYAEICQDAGTSGQVRVISHNPSEPNNFSDEPQTENSGAAYVGNIYNTLN